MNKRRLPRSQRKHTPKAKTKGLYTRAIQQAFVKLDPRIAIRNPVMFLVWLGTIITALVTINPHLFGDVGGENQRFFNALIGLPVMGMQLLSAALYIISISFFT